MKEKMGHMGKEKENYKIHVLLHRSDLKFQQKLILFGRMKNEISSFINVFNLLMHFAVCLRKCHEMLSEFHDKF